MFVCLFVCLVACFHIHISIIFARACTHTCIQYMCTMECNYVNVSTSGFSLRNSRTCSARGSSDAKSQKRSQGTHGPKTLRFQASFSLPVLASTPIYKNTNPKCLGRNKGVMGIYFFYEMKEGKNWRCPTIRSRTIITKWFAV